MVRFKNRWFLVEFIPCGPATRFQASGPSVGLGASDVETDSNRIRNALKQSVITHFGDVGWGAVGASLSVKYFSPQTNVCIIRVGRESHNVAWASLTLITTIEGRRYLPNVVHMSGTIKQAQLAAIRHNREVIARYRALAKTPVGYQDSYDEILQTSAEQIEALQD